MRGLGILWSSVPLPNHSSTSNTSASNFSSCQNPQVALCWNGVQIEGTAHNCGLVVDEPDRRFEKLYKEYLWGSYNKYSHEEDEIVIEITPRFVEVWDTSEDNYAFQIFIDFDKHSVEVKQYDHR